MQFSGHALLKRDACSVSGNRNQAGLACGKHTLHLECDPCKCLRSCPKVCRLVPTTVPGTFPGIAAIPKRMTSALSRSALYHPRQHPKFRQKGGNVCMACCPQYGDILRVASLTARSSHGGRQRRSPLFAWIHPRCVPEFQLLARKMIFPQLSAQLLRRETVCAYRRMSVAPPSEKPWCPSQRRPAKVKGKGQTRSVKVVIAKAQAMIRASSSLTDSMSCGKRHWSCCFSTAPVVLCH